MKNNIFYILQYLRRYKLDNPNFGRKCGQVVACLYGLNRIHNVSLCKHFPALKIRISIIPILIIAICFNGLSSLSKEHDYDFSESVSEEEYRAAIRAGCKDIKVKSPALAATLGILPGGGAFYTGDPATGTHDLLLWPFSAFWGPFTARDIAKERNRSATIEYCKKMHSINDSLNEQDNNSLPSNSDEAEF